MSPLLLLLGESAASRQPLSAQTPCTVCEHLQHLYHFCLPDVSRCLNAMLPPPTDMRMYSPGIAGVRRMGQGTGVLQQARQIAY